MNGYAAMRQQMHFPFFIPINVLRSQWWVKLSRRRIYSFCSILIILLTARHASGHTDSIYYLKLIFTMSIYFANNNADQL